MNGSIELMSKIVLCARKAILEGNDIAYEPHKWISSIEFRFTPRHVFDDKSVVCTSVEEWFQKCKEAGIVDIKGMVHSKVEDRTQLGFINVSPDFIICFWSNEKVTYFTPYWEFDRDRKGWDIVYEEKLWDDAPKGIPRFENRTEEFKKVLLEIRQLAIDLDYVQFAKVFQMAYASLTKFDESWSNKIPSYVPGQYKNLYYAVDIADVFGAMGSWNDGIYGEALKKNMGEKYNELSDRLLYYQRENLMYVVNESYSRPLKCISEEKSSKVSIGKRITDFLSSRHKRN